MVLSIPALALRRARTLRAMEDLRRGQRGVGAMEFALLAPVLVVSIIGLAAMSQGIRTKMLLTSAASSMAAMVAVQNSVTGGSVVRDSLQERIAALRNAAEEWIKRRRKKVSEPQR